MKNWRLWGLLIILLCLAPLPAEAEEGFGIWVSPGEGEIEGRLYTKPDSQSGLAAKVPAGQWLTVTGSSGKFYQVEWQGQTLYASQTRWEQISQLPPEPDTLPLPEAERPVGLQAHFFASGKREPLPLTGRVKLSQPATALCLYVYDSWQMSVECCLTATLQTPADVIDLEQYGELFSAKDLLPGWKKLYIAALCDEEFILLGRTEFFMTGEGNEPQTMNDCCSMPAKKDLSDHRLATGWTSAQAGGTLRITLPAGHTAALMTLEWRTPVSFRCTQKDSQGRILVRQDFNTGFYLDSVTLGENTKQIEVTVLSDQVTLANLNLYGPGYSTLAVQQWQNVPDAVDIMFIATHQDDETLFFGGGIPYYASSDYSTAVVFTVTCSRSRVHEALDAMWTAGLKTHPIFMAHQDSYYQTLERAQSSGETDVWLQEIVALLRMHRPKVIVTHDFEGEYGHGQHKITADVVAQAVTMAADPDYDPVSAAEYGIWQVQKLYIHLYEEQQLIMDWTQPLQEGSIVTPIFLANAAFSRHFSQSKEFSMEKHGALYDNRKFGLYFSIVGPDEACNDFMEHVQ